MICPYCQKETKYISIKTSSNWSVSNCDNHGNVKVIFTEIVKEIRFTDMTVPVSNLGKGEEYMLSIAHDINYSCVSVITGLEILPIIKFDYAIVISPEEFASKLKTWVIFS